MKKINDYKVIDLIATYENEYMIPDNERMTYWFGDYGMYMLKSEIRNSDECNRMLDEAYKKALEAVGWNERSFKKNTKKYTGRSIYRDAMQAGLLKTMPHDVEKMNNRQLYEYIKKDGMQLKDVPVERQTPEIKRVAIEQNGLALQFINQQDTEMCQRAVKKNGLALQFVHDKTWDICTLAYTSNKDSIKFMPDKMQNFFKKAYATVVSNPLEFHKRLGNVSEAGAEEWWNEHIKLGSICTMDSDGNVCYYDLKKSEAVFLNRKDIFEDAERYLRGDYPAGENVGAIVYYYSQYGERVSYVSANQFYMEIENNENCGVKNDIEINYINGKCIRTDKLYAMELEHTFNISEKNKGGKLIDEDLSVREQLLKSKNQIRDTYQWI